VRRWRFFQGTKDHFIAGYKDFDRAQRDSLAPVIEIVDAETGATLLERRNTTGSPTDNEAVVREQLARVLARGLRSLVDPNSLVIERRKHPMRTASASVVVHEASQP
jgi:hypothetical protein